MKCGRLLLIRHAETDLARTFCGSSNPPLNAAGDAQLAKLLETMPQQPPAVVYSSDLERALTTAKPIAARFFAPVRTIPDLREIDFGDWEALTWQQVEQRDPIYAQKWVSEFPRLPAPGGQTIDSFEKRVLDAFDTLVALDESAIVVTHAGVLRVILIRRCRATEDEAWRRTRDYCSFFHYPPGEASDDWK